MRCRCAFHKLKIIVYFCIPNLIVVTKQRGGKFANDSCFEKTRKEKKKKKRFQGWRLNARMNGTWLGRMEFLPIRVIRWATKNRRNCRGWKICLVRMLHFDTKISEKTRSIFAMRVERSPAESWQHFLKEFVKNINLANVKHVSLYFVWKIRRSHDWSIFA